MTMTKNFGYGEYYQTYKMQLTVWYDDDKKTWYYTTHSKKDAKDEWKRCECIFDKIKPHIDEMIKNSLDFIKYGDIKEYGKN